LSIIAKIKAEFSFIRGNYLLLVLSWILMDFALELPAIYQPALWALTDDSMASEKRGLGFSIITLINNVATTPAPIVMV